MAQPPRRSFLPVLPGPSVARPAPIVRADELDEVLAEAGGEADDAEDEVVPPPSMRAPRVAEVEEEPEATGSAEAAAPSEQARRWTPVEGDEDGGDDPECVVKARRRAHEVDGRVRAKTIAPDKLSREEKRAAALVVYPDDVERPRTRGDCASMPRPCPFVSCSHHLYLDVNPESGAIKLNQPHLEVWEMAETCSLDVADRGGITLEEVGAMTNLTRERIRQIEVRGLEKIKREFPEGEAGSSAGPALRHPFGEVAA